MNYFEICHKQLLDEEKKNRERPPGDDRARIDWVCRRIREMVISAEIRKGDGKNTVENERQIEEMFKKI